MRVLMCGGTKTNNIAIAMESNLKSSGIDFIVEPYIENIKEIFARGEYFDRAILIEQGWTHDNANNDEYTIRNRLNSFVNDITKRNLPADTTYVFLSQTSEMATIVSEEILPIMSSSALVVKKPKYHVNFFKTLVTNELADFPDEIIYKPPVIEAEPEMEADNEIQQNQDRADFDHNDFDTLDKNANRLPIDEGFDGDLDREFSPDFSDMFNDFDGDPSDTFNIQPGEAPQSDDYTPLPSGDDYEDNFDPFNQWQDQNQGEFDQSQGDFDQDQNGFEQDQNGFEQDQNGFEQDIDPFEQFDQWQDQPQDQPQDQGGFEEDIDPFGQTQDKSTDNTDYTDYTDYSDQDQDNFDDNQGMGDNDYQSEPEPPISNIDENNEFSDPEFYDNNFEGDYQNPVYPDENIEQEPPKTVRQSGEIPDWSGPDDYQMYETPVNQETDIGSMMSDEYGYQDPVNTETGSMFDDEYPTDNYEPEPEEIEETNNKFNTSNKRNNLNDQQIRDAFAAFASRGNSIVVTGCGGCGTSTVALNLANTICNLGYNVLLVDMDTKNKAQSYISKENYDSLDVESAGVMQAVNSTSGINAYVSIVRQGFHLLTMGMASDSREIKDAFKQEKLARFVNMAKSSHNFVIFDIPFDAATSYLETITYSADNIVLVTDASNWGIAKTLINICNIGSDDMEETLFSRAQILFNRYRGLNKVFNKKVKKPIDILKAMDKKMLNLIGEDTGYYFSDMHICGVLNFDQEFENGWFENVQYSDTKKGNQIFVQLLKNIVLHT